MAATWNKKGPLCRVSIWAPGQARPFVKIRSWAKYDLLKESAGNGLGTFSYTSGAPDLEWLDVDSKRGVLSPRGELRFQDTRLSQYSLVGDWEERRPSGGRDQKYRLVHYPAAADTEFSATSGNSLPAQANVAFTLSVAETVPDNDPDGFPPYNAVELGAAPNFWRVELSKKFGARLLWRAASGDTWQQARDLPEPQNASNSEGAEAVVYVICRRSSIGVSTDRGKSYKWAPGVLPAGPVIFRGQGGFATFGCHQLFMRTGAWASPAHATFTTTRNALAALDFTGSRYDQTYGTCAFTDLSSLSAGLAQWRVTLTPATGGSPFGWAVYRTPEVVAVLARYEAEPSLLGGTGLHFIDYFGSPLTCDVDKPADLEHSRAELTTRLEATEPQPWIFGRLPHCQIELGNGTDDGSGDQWTVVMNGPIDLANLEQNRWNDLGASLTVENATYYLRLAKWSRLDTYPFTSLSLGAALDAILASEAIPLNDSYRVWPSLFYSLILGGDDSPEKPFGWPRAGEDKWKWVKDLCGLFSYEPFADDTGVLTALPIGFVQPAVSKTYEAVPDTDLSALVRSLRWSYAGSEVRTAIMVDGEDADGNLLVTTAVDAAAETLPASGRFTSVRLLEQETMEGSCSMGMLLTRTQALANQWFREPDEVQVQHPVDLGRNRRDLVEITGFLQPVPDPSRYVIVTLRQHFEADPSLNRCSTTAGLALRI